MTKHKHCELIKAWADGAQIEYFDVLNKGWTLVGRPLWDVHSEYRIAQIPDSINWGHVSPEYKFMARDADGQVYLYKNKPFVDAGKSYWYIMECVDAKVFSSYTKGNVPWNESLVERK